MPDLRPIFLAGPTAVGKSEIALFSAAALGAEIISVDSMQVYRGLDIGTAKPSMAERQQVPHHLIDLIDPGEPFDAAAFARHARACEEELRARGVPALFCGGTGLYFKAYLHGLGEAPPADPDLRRALEQLSTEALCAELDQADPVLSRRIDRKNRRRLTRAVEVIRLTGRPFSEQRGEWLKGAEIKDHGSETRRREPGAGGEGNRFFILDREPGDLRRRIDVRVDAMIARGWVAETQALVERGLPPECTALQAIGYRQITEHLKGHCSLDESVAVIKTRTRQFAKRQRTWFKHQTSGHWLHLAPDVDARSVSRQLLELLENAGSADLRRQGSR